MRVLLLGGTTEAGQMAAALAATGIDAVYSYAGRTATPVAQPLPTRTGGFGGIDGLADWLRAERVTHVIDATHPFAAGMSRNAVAACAQTGAGLIALERPPWVPQQGDLWTPAASPEAAAVLLPERAQRVFLAIGRQTLGVFAARPQHHYILRLVDPPGDLPLPHHTVVLARGPFDLAGDLALLRDHAVDLIVAKNAGGQGAEAKLTAARMLAMPVILIDRPAVPPRRAVARIDEVLHWLHHGPTDRGV